MSNEALKRVNKLNSLRMPMICLHSMAKMNVEVPQVTTHLMCLEPTYNKHTVLALIGGCYVGGLKCRVPGRSNNLLTGVTLRSLNCLSSYLCLTNFDLGHFVIGEAKCLSNV